MNLTQLGVGYLHWVAFSPLRGEKVAEGRMRGALSFLQGRVFSGLIVMHVRFVPLLPGRPFFYRLFRFFQLVPEIGGLRNLIGHTGMIIPDLFEDP
jgi:hypothetical protein